MPGNVPSELQREVRVFLRRLRCGGVVSVPSGLLGSPVRLHGLTSLLTHCLPTFAKIRGEYFSIFGRKMIRAVFLSFS